MNNKNFLTLKNISKSYGKNKILDNINFEIKSNEFFTILGSSGSGKSTIIRMIGGFINPSSGDITFENTIINNQPIFERPFNTVFQDYALFPNMNVFNNVGFGLKIRNINKEVIKQKVLEVLSIVGLESFAKRMPQELSGGQQQRVALARAIICEPKIILLDEPLGALDAELRKQMQLFLKEIQKKINIAFIFITHDQEEAIFLSDRIAVLNEHKFEQIGTPKELYYKPSTPYLAKFFGECNLFECNIINIKNDIILLDSHLGKFETKTKSKNIKVGDDIIYGIRPEEIAITDIKKDNSIELIIKDIDFKGPNSILHLTNKSRNLTIKLQKISSNISKTYTIDSVIHINFNIESGNVFLK
jgi:spermidine/putrescine transport system ATP-binding protein